MKLSGDFSIRVKNYNTIRKNNEKKNIKALLFNT